MQRYSDGVESRGFDETNVFFRDIDVAKLAPKTRRLLGTNQGLDDPRDLRRSTGVRELEHIAFRDQPVTEIDSLDGKAVTMTIDQTRPLGANEFGRRGDRGRIRDDEGDNERQSVEPAESKATLVIANAHQPYPSRADMKPKSCQRQWSRRKGLFPNRKSHKSYREERASSLDDAARLGGLHIAIGKVRLSMYGMPLAQALLLVAAVIVLVAAIQWRHFHPFLAIVVILVAAVIVLVAAIQWRHFHPFLAIVVIASAFGSAAGFSTGLIAKAFGTGFSQAIYSPGLVIVAAGLVAGLAESAAAFDRLRAVIDQRRWLASTRIAALVGLIAGIGASPTSAFAILMPLLRAIGGGAVPKREAATTALALAISASHGLALLSPVPIAAAAILGAAWGRVALFGLPLAILLVVVGMAWARFLLVVVGAATDPFAQELHPISETQSGWPANALLLATGVPLLMLMVQSLGDIPNEPLGGGPVREMILGLGRPLVLFWVGLGIMAIGLWRLSMKLLADTTWTGRILANVSGAVLILGAAGGLQSLCQETGMAELLGERLLGFPGGLLVPFLVAAMIKTLQGTSPVSLNEAELWGVVRKVQLPSRQRRTFDGPTFIEGDSADLGFPWSQVL
jgi:GntP family gluconate:H+ symporter